MDFLRVHLQGAHKNPNLKHGQHVLGYNEKPKIYLSKFLTC